MDNERFQRNDNLAPFFDSSKSKQRDVSRSSFDFSRSHSFQLDFGMLSVADCFETIPNGTYQLSSNINAQFRIPTNRKLINNCRIFVEYYYCKESDLWEGAHNTVTKGRSGNIQKQYPHLVFDFQDGANPLTHIRFDTPDSLMDDFGLPCSVAPAQGIEGSRKPKDFYKPVIIEDVSSSNATDYVELLERNDYLYINALPFVMYQKVCRDYYLPKNLIQKNTYILPHNEEHFILPYNATAVGFLDYDLNPSEQDVFSLNYAWQDDYNFSEITTKVILAQKRFRQLRGDTFTTAFPFPDGIRGDIPTLDFSGDTDSLSITIPDLKFYGETSDGSPVDDVTFGVGNDRYAYLSNSGSGALVPFKPVNAQGFNSDGNMVNPFVVNGVKGSDVNVSSTFSSSVTLNDIRTLETFTVFQERMARTDGDYSEMLKAQFGYTNIKTDRRPVYIGGFYQDILVNSVYQTSESTSNSPLGRQSGIGISSGSHNVGSFTAPDFGYIMAIVSVVPEIYYNTGIEKMFSRRVQSDKYFPIMNDLPPTPILNKELFVFGNPETDDDIFAYQERNSEYKSRRNLITGKGRFFKPVNNSVGTRVGAEPIDIYDNSRVIVKNLITTPNLNAEFVTAQDIDLSVFSVTDEMPIDMDFGSLVRAILPMPYVSVPGGLNDNY